MSKPGKKAAKKKWYQKLKWKYRLVIMNDDTLEKRVSFRITRLNVFVATGTAIILLIFLTTILIAFTPLREYIPGYTDITLRKSLYELQLRTDSIDRVLTQKDLFIKNLRQVITGEIADERDTAQLDTTSDFEEVEFSRSLEDSLLRAQVESINQFNIIQGKSGSGGNFRETLPGNLVFFPPVKGVLTNGFNPDEQHFGIDIVAEKNEAVKSVLDGTVIVSTWTVKTGYIIGIQHPQGIVSIYKHNAALMKQEGDMVRAGEVIAIIGTSGIFSSGPHLHLELWDHGTPVDPARYISF